MADNFSWRATNALNKYGICIYNYEGKSEHSLTLQIGTCLHLVEEYGPKTPGNALWYRGYSLKNKDKRGIFPASYVHIKPCKVENEGRFENILPTEDPVMKEVTFVLRDWAVKWKKLYLESHPLFSRIEEVMMALINYRRQLVQNTITEDQLFSIKNEIIMRIDWGNGKLGLDLVPRIDGEIIDDEKHSVISLYRVHCSSVETSKGTWPRKMTMSRQRSSKENRHYDTHHVLVNVRGFPCNVGDEAEIYLSIFDAETNQFISEKFLVRYSKQGMPTSMDKIDAFYGLFLDLSEEDINKDLFLVAQIYRYGKIIQDSHEQTLKGKVLLDNNSKKAPVFKYRRPWGCAVHSLKDVLKTPSEDELEYQIRIQSCVDAESNMTNLHETLIKKAQNPQKSLLSDKSDRNNFGMAISLRMFMGDLPTVKTENPILFTKDVAIAQRLGFSDTVVNPGEVRNDLYLTINSAEFDRGTKKSAKNVEIDISIFDINGDIIPDCINCGCGEGNKTVYNTSVFYHQNSPKWNDIIRLSIPIEKFTGAHIRLEFYHCSTRDKNEKKLQGFSYLVLTGKDNSTVYDGPHELCIYKCDDLKKIRDYKNLPMYQDEFTDIQKTAPPLPFQRNSKEYCLVSTLLCSTKFTQNTGLLSVLQWAINRDKIADNLRNLIRLRSQEIVKYLQDILDALFAMFGAKNGERVPFASDVFHALVHIFNILEHTQFEKFQHILESYLEENFCHPLVFRDLMFCLQEKVNCASQLSDSRTDVPVEVTLLVLEPLFKFTVKSCNLFKRAYGSDMVNTRLFKDIYSIFGNVLESKDDKLKKAQVILLTELHKTYKPLLSVMSKKELSEMVVNVLNRVARDSNKDVVKAKTQIIKNTINSELFEDTESRSLLLPLCLAHIKKCLIQRGCLKITSETLGDLLDKIFLLKKSSKTNDDINQVVLAVFDVIIESLLKMEASRRIEIGGMLISSLIELLNIMEDSHYQALLSAYHRGQPLKDFLNRVFLVFRDLIRRDVFPPDWSTMRMTTNHAILTAIQYLTQSLTDHFLTRESFDKSIWDNYFDLSVAFITQPSLQLHDFTESKKHAFKDKYGDMRVLLGYKTQNLWNALGEHQKVFIPSIIGSFLEITLVPERDLRKATLPMFFDMMICEQKISGNFNKVECEMIERLDELMTSNYGDHEFRLLFKTILLEKVQTEPSIQEEGKKFVFSVTDLLDRLLDYRQVIDGEENRDKRMHCTFNILNFYKKNINREEMYIRYITKLYDLHVGAKNYVEAGLTLQLYAQQILDWKYDVFPADSKYPSQPEWERKETLYLEIIDCFDKGQAWEYGIPLCKELAVLYETRLFNYQKLSDILQKQAQFFTNILEGIAQIRDPSYYRVAYYGKSFPPFVRNKAFVYRGDECLKLSTIMQQLMTEFPNAKILSSNSPPEDSIKEGDAQYIQICIVKPIADPRPEFKDANVPNEISNFYNVNEVDTFQFDRPYHKGEKDKNNEFKTLCLERTMLKTSYKLPGILRWYEVIDASVVHISPLETATESIKQVNKEFRFLIDRCKTHPDNYLQNLTMRLKGVISATVSGGIPKYQEAFFTNDFANENPDQLHHLEELRGQLIQQVKLLDEALQLHGTLASQAIQPLHKNLVEMFENMRRGITDSGSPRPSRLLHSMQPLNGSPRPSTPSTTSLHSSSSNRSSVISGDIMSQEEENVYCEPSDVPTELGGQAAPPMPEKRRVHSFHVANPLTQRAVGLTSSPPPIPKRPQSAIYPGSTVQPKSVTRIHPRTVSEPSIDTHTSPTTHTSPSINTNKGLSQSLSSEQIDHQAQPEHRTSKFYTATPDMSGYDIAPPPLPKRKNSDSSLLFRAPPPPPRPAPDKPHNIPNSILVSNNDSDRPPIPVYRQRRSTSIPSGLPHKDSSTLAPLKEVNSSGGENSAGEQPPLPPRTVTRSNTSVTSPKTSQTPSIPPFPTQTPVLQQAGDNSVAPPPIPKRVSLAPRRSSLTEREETKF